MKLAIVQPYFLPYIGYFQLLHAVDQVVIYDNIEYTKKGWINRNRVLLNGKIKTFTIPLKKDSDFLHVDQRFLADNASKEKKKILAQIRQNYAKSPHFESVYPVIESVFLFDENNLAGFILNSIVQITNLLGISTERIMSSDVPIDHTLKKEEKVISLCRQLNADKYINSIGGVKLYDKEKFKEHGITLKFLKTNELEYDQKSPVFYPHLSIIDALMYNGEEETRQLLKAYEMI